ncbi:unnamed protein product, partial [Vitis vinifera]
MKAFNFLTFEEHFTFSLDDYPLGFFPFPYSRLLWNLLLNFMTLLILLAIWANSSLVISYDISIYFFLILRSLKGKVFRLLETRQGHLLCLKGANEFINSHGIDVLISIFS